MKINDLCLKYDTPLSEEELRKILQGDIGWMRDSGSGLIKEFYAKIRYQRLKPRVLVSYLREPYIYNAGNVRVTFDSEIRTTLYDQEFLKKDVKDISAAETPEFMLLEIKYDEYLPDIIRDIVQMKGARQQAFSKYGACRRYG